MSVAGAITALGWAAFLASTTLLVARLRIWSRRRERLNESFHELRRPLQALTLASGLPKADRHTAVWQVELACAALTDAEHALNGGPSPVRRSPVGARGLLREACGRWQSSALRSGRRITWSWDGPAAAVLVSASGLTMALDNLIANALEHGSGDIALAGEVRGWKVRLSVRNAPRLGTARTGGRGLRIVKRMAADTGARFSIGPGPRGCVQATLELPVHRLGSPARPVPAGRLAHAA